MKKVFLSLTFIFINLYGFAQKKFEKGYFINKDDNKVECYILNKDWRTNPKMISYRLSEEDEVQTINIKNLKEFSIGDHIHYKKFFLLKIDKSASVSQPISLLTVSGEPEYTFETLLLKSVVRGKSNLYYYKDLNKRIYFYTKPDSAGTLTQLIYKRYKVGDKIATNDFYKTQLSKDLTCGNTPMNTKLLSYALSDLTKFFVKYNECQKANYINYQEAEKKRYQSRDKFNLQIRPSIGVSSLSSPENVNRINFENQINTPHYRIGLYSEYFLLRDKWSLFVEPTLSFSSIEAKSTFSDRFETRYDLDFIWLSFFTGARYYASLSPSSKLFFNAGAGIHLHLREKLESEGDLQSSLARSEQSGLSTSISVNIGAGYQFISKYSLEFRYDTGRSVTDNILVIDSNYSNLCVLLGIKLF